MVDCVVLSCDLYPIQTQIIKHYNEIKLSEMMDKGNALTAKLINLAKPVNDKEKNFGQ